MNELLVHTTGEREDMRDFSIEEVGHFGFGDKHAAISLDKWCNNPDDTPEQAELKLAMLAKTKEIIASGECMAKVTEADDGCIDGRPSEIIQTLRGGQIVDLSVVNPLDDKPENLRYKLAGGGAVTGSAMVYAFSQAEGHPIDEVIARTTQTLVEKGMPAGVHTGPHCSTMSSDCGANDKMQAILEAGVSLRSQVNEATKYLCSVGGVQLDDRFDTDIVYKWSDAAHAEHFNGSTGKSRHDLILSQADNEGDKPAAVSKKALGDHNEACIVVNYADGYSFSQKRFTKKIHEAFPNVPLQNLPQVFVVDVPRVIEVARTLTEDSRDEDDFYTALAAGVAYQVATSSTLTDGSLANFIVQ